MKNIKKILSLVLVAISILTIISCGVNKVVPQTSMLRLETTSANINGALGFTANTKMAAKSMAMEDASYDMGYTSYGSEEDITTDRKIVKTVDLNTETKTFDESIEWLKSYIASFGGIVDNSYVDTGNMNDRNYRKNANFNVRIPAEKLDGFLNKLGDNLNVTFRQENISDITEEYYDTESRLKSLKIEEENLNSMLGKAKTVDEMIKVEDKLSSVRTEIENITRRIKRYDRQVTYSTVRINILEVKDLTEPQVEEDDFSKETLQKQLKQNFENVKLFIKRIGANIFTNIPWILLVLLVLLITTIIFTIVKSILNRSKKKIKLDHNKNNKTNKNKQENAETKNLQKNDTSDKNEEEVEVEFYQNENK